MGVTASFSAPLLAQEPDGQSFRIGDTELIPEATIKFVHNDNIYNSHENPTESSGVVVSPSVNWVADRRLLKLSASYSGAYGVYDESILNFTDHNLSFRAAALPAKRHRAFAEFNFSRSHEEIGTGQTVSDPDVTDEVVSNTTSLEAGYVFGSSNAKGNIGGGLILSTQTFNDLGEVTEGDDNSVLKPYAFLSYRLSADTRLVGEVRYSVFDFEEDRRDRAELAFLTGVDLNPTARSGGRIRLGVSRAVFDTQGISDRTTLISDISVYYNIRTYSKLNLTYNRRLQTLDDDDSGAGEAIVDNLRFSWNHNWSARVFSTVGYGLSINDRECPNIDTTTNGYGFSLNTKIRRWLTVGAGVDLRQRTADYCDNSQEIESADSDQTIMSVFVKSTL